MRIRPFLIILCFSLGLMACEAQEMQAENTPAPFDPLQASIKDLNQGLKEGHWTVREITETYLNQIEKLNLQGPSLHAVISVNPQALEIADSLDRLWAEGKSLGALHGIPVILKDNIESLDKMPTTAGSRALANNYVGRDAPLVAKLRAAGAIILAKANLSEWANFRGQNSISGWSGMGGFTRNPFVLSRNPCGSSAGSAVAVAAGLAPVAIGTETNGSIICPSQTNGVVGLKPTVGLVPGTGIIPIAWSQDVAGPITHTVSDLQLVLSIIAEADPKNPAQLTNWPPVNWTPFWEQQESLPSEPLSGKRIGYFTEALGTDARVDDAFENAKNQLMELGAELFEVSEILKPGTNYASYQVMLYEYHIGLNDYLGRLDSQVPIHSISDLIAFNKQDTVELKYFGQEYLEYALAMDINDTVSYQNNLSLMHRYSRELGIDRIMDSLNLDAIIAPSGSPAWVIDPVNGDHFILSSSSPAAISGYPNLSIPMGMVQGLPIGISIFGRALDESQLLEIASELERQLDVKPRPKFLPQDSGLKK